MDVRKLRISFLREAILTPEQLMESVAKSCLACNSIFNRVNNMISNRPSYADKMTNLKYAIMGLSGKTEREAQEILNLKYNLYKDLLFTVSTGSLAIFLIKTSSESTKVANFINCNFTDGKNKLKNTEKSDTNLFVNRDMQMTTGQDMYGNPYTGDF